MEKAKLITTLKKIDWLRHLLKLPAVFIFAMGNHEWGFFMLFGQFIMAEHLQYKYFKQLMKAYKFIELYIPKESNYDRS